MDGGLGHDLREARRSSGLTFRRFAALAGYSEGHLRSVENSRREVTIDVAEAYDRVLKSGGTFVARFVACQSQVDAALRPWGQDGTTAVLHGLLSGGDVDRRSFVAASGAALTTVASRWKSALDLPEPLTVAGTRQISPSLVAHIEQRLDHLRHLDDELGSGELAALARSELALVAQLLKVGRYTDQVSRRLYSLAAEASRQVAWDHFDQDHHVAAQRYFEMALRASATADDPITGAYALSFMAVQCYSTGLGEQAVSLLETARSAVTGKSTARMAAMLAARSARALSKTGNRQATAHMLYEARAALDHGPHPDDPPTLYWVTEGEIEMIAGSCALELGDPAEAIRRFDAAIDADYPGDDQYPRSHAIYMARAAEAHLATRDLDAAVHRANHAMRCLDGVDSARSKSTLSGLRKKLARYDDVSVVNEFLEATR